MSNSQSSEYDFISVGGGIGGLMGALVAHEAGLKPLVMEKTSQIGGVAALSLGQVWVPRNGVAAGLGIADSLAQGLEYMEWVGGGFAERAYAETFLQWGPGVVSFLADRANVAWRLWRGQPDYYYPVAPGSVDEGRCLEVEPFDGHLLGEWATQTRVPDKPQVTNEERAHGVDQSLVADRATSDVRTQGSGLAGYLVRNALDRGIELRTSTEVVRLFRENGRVVGVVAKRDGTEQFIRASRGVLLATSGYDWSADMVRQFDARTSPSSLTMPEVTGDHLRMAGALGAQVISLSPRPQWIDHRFRLGDSLERLNTSLPGVMMVDQHGSRFADESFGPSFTAALSNIDVDQPRLAHQPFWGIFDQRYRESYPVGPIAPGESLPKSVFSAETPEELARLTGIDPEGLRAEFDRFNRDSVAGVDPRFGRGTRPISLGKGDRDTAHPTLGPLVQSPFYAVPLVTASIGIPLVGIGADTTGRVLDWEGEPIPGLYVAGNSMALYETGVGYQSGYANTRALVFAALGACDAAGVAAADIGLAGAEPTPPQGVLASGSE